MSTTAPVSYDDRNLFEAALGGSGLPGDLPLRRRDALSRAHSALHARVSSGELPFLRLHEDQETTARVARYAASTAGRFDDCLVLGIGGSSLGGRTLVHALGGRRMRVHFPDNLDPGRFGDLLASVDLRRTVVVAISKSGGTLETLAQLLIARQRLIDALGAEALARHLVVVTDPERGVLRELAQAEDLTTFEIPPGVGGRFSAFTPVGLLPAALAGVDVDELMEGVGWAAQVCESADPARNPALSAACALHALDADHGRGILYTVPYSDALRPLSEWFSQLWAESLGKADAGPTPVPAVGATDQHSQLQRWMEGAPTAVVAFVEVEDFGVTLPIPAGGRLGEVASVRWLVGHDLGHVLRVERQATAQALTEAGRPNLTWRIPSVSARSLSALMTLWEAMTAYAGVLYDIDAFDQPGVEAGKVIAKRLLGA